jgi:hypothetical protein
MALNAKDPGAERLREITKKDNVARADIVRKMK